MGKFTDTKVADTINNITEGKIDRMGSIINNQQQRSKVVVEYYAINRDASKIDESTGLVEDNYGPNSPIRFNKINNFVMYTDGFLLSTNNVDTDFGPEGDIIQGTCSIAPRTLVPVPGELFRIPHMKGAGDLLFKVIEVNTYLLDGNATWFEIEWVLDKAAIDLNVILKYNVEEEFEYVVKNAGTELNPFIQSTKYALAKDLDDTNDILRKYYLELFFNNSVQALTYRDEDGRGIYDEMLTEFCATTGILSDHKNFVYLHHQVPKSYQFNFKYRMTLFSCLLEKNLKRLNDRMILNRVWIEHIERPDVVFYTRVEPYFETKYDIDTKISIPETCIITPFEPELLDCICKNELMEDDILSNIIIKFMNNNLKITNDDIIALKDIYMNNTVKLFYYLPCIIYIIDNQIKKLMAETEE